ncbi:transcriptional regulator, gntR family [Actinoalloteichus fjordicus]|uniref:5'-deoxynucleotidase n=1 Tax=Actinoalloteichus fjordicus TaxID=1612552 RepID=A0AAC9LA91_9PSEU|nr:transcriptional regulator, gntR family [Actinoalloteichus fjordicus]
MQPLDPDDPRSPSVKIAAIIRAAILSGELEPEAQLPTGDELAKFFGVTGATVSSAIRTVRDEGFVQSRPGGGVYVTGQASLPVPEGQVHPLVGLGAFLHEAGHLKNLPRSGWQLLGIQQPESVAEHSFRVGIIGMALAAMEGADPGRTAALCLMHDVPETRIGDVPSVGRAYVTTAVPQAVTAHQTAALPAELATVFQGLTAEYEDTETLGVQGRPRCRQDRDLVAGEGVRDAGVRHRALAGHVDPGAAYRVRETACSGDHGIRCAWLVDELRVELSGTAGHHPRPAGAEAVITVRAACSAGPITPGRAPRRRP